jgi:predicted amidohydrolase YtcJ
LSLLLRNARLWPDLAPGSVLVADGRIAALEDRPADELVDLDGALLLPGFVDTHTHLGWAGRALLRARWSGSDARERLAAARGRLPDGFWLLGGWSDGAALPTLAELDAVSAGAPAFLTSEDGQTALVNSEAMRLMRLGEVVGDTGGVLRGVDARRLQTAGVVPPPDRHRLRAELAAALAELPRLGIVEAHDIATVPGEPEPQLLHWERSFTDATLYDELDLPVRVSMRPSLHRRNAFQVTDCYKGRKARLEGLKLFAGVSYRYPGRQVARGWIREAHAAGLPVSVHATAAEDVAETLDLFEGLAGVRHRLVHAYSVRPPDVVRTARLGLTVEAQPLDALARPRESRRGRIAVGFDADLVAIAAEPDAILDGMVRLTLCAGRVTHAG